MRIAIDPYMHRHLSFEELPRKPAELGCEGIELSPRATSSSGGWRPRVYPERIQSFKKALKHHGVKIASLLPMYRWASPHEDERQTAVALLEEGHPDRRRDGRRHDEFRVRPRPLARSRPFGQLLRRTIHRRDERSRVVAFDGGTRADASRPRESSSTSSRIRRTGVETLHPALDMIRMIGSKNVKFLYCAPHTFYFGDDMAKMIRDAAPLLAHVHVADTYNHKASSGLRYICNPPGAQVTVHQHMDIGQGEIDLGRVLLLARRDRLRRDHDRVRLRLGGARRPIRALHARADAEIRRQVLGQGRKPKSRGAPARLTNWHAKPRKRT